MSVASCLLLYSAIVIVLGPRLLSRLTRSGASPRWGVAVWLAAMGSVLGAWVVAAVFLAGEAIRDENQPGRTVADLCFAVLRSVAAGGHGVLIQVGLLVFAGLGAAAAIRLTWRLGRSIWRAQVASGRHARMARLVGRRVDGVDAVVLDATERVAYCVAGRPHTVVVTSSAVAALDERQLAAVLAHERAHLAGRHHLLLAMTRALATILPSVALFTTGAEEVARSLEMCADDAAACSHGSDVVLGALLSLSGAATMPAGALGATGVGLLARVHRLADPPGTGRRLRLRALLAGSAMILVAGPVLVAVLAATGSALCGLIAG